MFKSDIVRWWILSIALFFAVRVFAAEMPQNLKELAGTPVTQSRL